MKLQGRGSTVPIRTASKGAKPALGLCAGGPTPRRLPGRMPPCPSPGCHPHTYSQYACEWPVAVWFGTPLSVWPRCDSLPEYETAPTREAVKVPAGGKPGKDEGSSKRPAALNIRATVLPINPAKHRPLMLLGLGLGYGGNLQPTFEPIRRACASLQRDEAIGTVSACAACMTRSCKAPVSIGGQPLAGSGGAKGGAIGRRSRTVPTRPQRSGRDALGQGSDHQSST